MGCITQPYYDQGKAEGKAEGNAAGMAAGITKGVTAGKAQLLTRFLERRFGPIPAPLRQQILAGDLSSIEAWADRAFEAPDLQSIFDSN